MRISCEFQSREVCCSVERAIIQSSWLIVTCRSGQYMFCVSTKNNSDGTDLLN